MRSSGKRRPPDKRNRIRSRVSIPVAIQPHFQKALRQIADGLSSHAGQTWGANAEKSSFSVLTLTLNKGIPFFDGHFYVVLFHVRQVSLETNGEPAKDCPRERVVFSGRSRDESESAGTASCFRHFYVIRDSQSPNSFSSSHVVPVGGKM